MSNINKCFVWIGLISVCLAVGCSQPAVPQTKSTATGSSKLRDSAEPAARQLAVNNPAAQESVATDNSAKGSNDLPQATSEQALPIREPMQVVMASHQGRYARSEACQECHQSQYNSWHSTFHRTMTQEATPESIRGNFDGQLVEVAGYPCQPFRQGDRFYMTLVHPEWTEQEIAAGRDPRDQQQPPPITYAVDRVIGSHHQQVYLSRGPDGTYHTLPIVWHIDHERWITRKGSFLQAPRDSFYHMTKTWNNGCVFCHNTGPDPGLQELTDNAGRPTYVWDTTVKELGIACEACHGPGAAHTEQQQARARNATSNAETTASSDSLIVSPHKLSKVESVLACARCHGKMIAKKEFDRQCLTQGDFFRPGEWDFVDRYDHPDYDTSDEFVENKDGLYFWSDGTPRTTALEYQGVLLSPCYQRGEMTCMSCHSMHDSKPNDQLIHDATLSIAQQNQACTQCHMELRDEATASQHSHHASSSTGSLCYNCHMPYQSYSLLKRTRSHRISNPTATSTAEAGIPNACNQCHVDQTLQWTNQRLAEWKNESPAELTSEFADASQTIVHALSGNALQRALAIEQLGDSENFDLAGTGWRAAILIEGLKDDYEANRFLACEALRKLDGFHDFAFDYLAREEQRAAQIQLAEETLAGLQTNSSQQRLLKLLGGSSTDDIRRLIDSLLAKRNRVEMQVLE